MPFPLMPIPSSQDATLDNGKLMANQSKGSAQEVTVSCRGVTVRYGNTTAVHDATFDVHAGEVLGLLGPNGAGKTSLIRALTTILPLAGGEATVAGFDRRQPDLVRTRVGVLPESSGYPNQQTAIEYVSYYGRLYGVPAKIAQARGMSLINELGLGPQAHSRIRTFSRGMKQRLGISRALINQPAVLFLDEPTLGLDPAGQYEVLKHIRGIADQNGTTVILTSHLLEEISQICDRIVIMNKGRVVAAGSLDDVVSQAGVARFVRLRVSPIDVDKVVSLLSTVPQIVAAHPEASRVGELRIEIGESGVSGANLIAEALVSAQIPILSLELEGTTLNDAFLNLTDAPGEQRK